MLQNGVLAYYVSKLSPNMSSTEYDEQKIKLMIDWSEPAEYIYSKDSEIIKL